MSLIHILDEPTINQIAAGEVVERPSAVVKELIENAVDAGATAITAEIKEGGLSLIRITDNGEGIAKEDIALAFLRHATSKIRSAEDLLSVTSLGFRGEALSSIAAVSQVEVITKTPTSLNGFRYVIEGGEEKSMEEIGCPGGTTILVRNLFYNTPARRKFLKSAMTEAGYISDLMERLMVSHPAISFKFIVNNQIKLQSSGNNNSKDILYHVYGRDISKELLSVEFDSEDVKITGFIGKPLVTRGNRNNENYFINGRYIKSTVITKAIEEAYKPYLMQHKYPFTSLYFEINPSLIDVNVHPQKMEIRLKNSEEIYQLTWNAIRNTISGKEMIPKVTLMKQEVQQERQPNLPEPFEESRRRLLAALENSSGKSDLSKEAIGLGRESIELGRETLNIGNETMNLGKNAIDLSKGTIGLGKGMIGLGKGTIDLGKEIIDLGKENIELSKETIGLNSETLDSRNDAIDFVKDIYVIHEKSGYHSTEEALLEQNKLQQGLNLINSQLISQNKSSEQLNLFTTSEESADAPFLSRKAFEEHRIIGQVFSTYWLVEYKKDLFIIDQHAAHEKVLYEKIMAAAKDKTFESQLLLPPIVLTITLREQEVLRKYEEVLSQLGYEFEHFGGNEYSVRAVPADLYGLSEKDLLLEFVDDLSEDFVGAAPNASSILERVASLSCKAAVKANHTFSKEEADALIRELLTLKNPYFCPHGRPVIISMSQYELEKKFKRIL